MPTCFEEERLEVEDDDFSPSKFHPRPNEASIVSGIITFLVAPAPLVSRKNHIDATATISTRLLEIAIPVL